MYSEYNGFNTPTPPPKKNGGWKIAVAVAVAVLVLALLICATAVFVTWIRNYYGAEQNPGSEATSALTTIPTEYTKPNATEPPATERTTASSTEATQHDPISTEPAEGTEVKSTPTIYNENIDAVVSITSTFSYYGGFYPTTYTGTGSGFVVSSDGVIITCNHVVESASSVSICLYDGTEYDAQILGCDESTDVAVLKINATGLKTVTLGDSDQIIIGEDAIVIGNPQQLDFSVSKGIISATDRVVNVDDNKINAFQTDAAINGGNSGGPVFNNRGEVIGMVDAKYASSEIEGLGFALPINQVLNIANDLIEHGHVTGRPYFGVSVSTALVSRGYAVNGARVELIDNSSCAGKAGLQIGDIITAIDDYEIASGSDLVAAKDYYKAGDTAILKVWRAGSIITLSITFDEANS